jgi:hypothetical protein
VGDGVPDEDLAGAGTGHATGAVVRVGAGADDGRVADAAVELVRQPAGRGPGRQTAPLQGHRADGPEIPVRTPAALEEGDIHVAVYRNDERKMKGVG